jgi:ParB-like nuclease family protein
MGTTTTKKPAAEKDKKKADSPPPAAAPPAAEPQRATINQTEMVPVAELKAHPRNYKTHPIEQITHLMKSIRDHGFYRNVVIAKDGTILAGHGVVQAVKQMGLFAPERVPCVRLNLAPEDPLALKILVTDNEVGKLAETNDRVLTEILRDVLSVTDILGTGYDPQSLSLLVMHSRPVEEIKSKNEAAEWVGMPEFDDGEILHTMKMLFPSPADREEFVRRFDIKVIRKAGDDAWWTAWWPPRETMDRTTVLFDQVEEG